MQCSFPGVQLYIRNCAYCNCPNLLRRIIDSVHQQLLVLNAAGVQVDVLLQQLLQQLLEQLLGLTGNSLAINLSP